MQLSVHSWGSFKKLDHLYVFVFSIPIWPAKFKDVLRGNLRCQRFKWPPHTDRAERKTSWSWSSNLLEKSAKILTASKTMGKNTEKTMRLVFQQKNGQGSGFGYWSFFCFHRDMQFWRLSQQDSAIEGERKTYQLVVFLPCPSKLAGP